MKTLIKKQTLLVFVSLLFATTSYGQWKAVKGNGNMTTIIRATDSYDAIKCAGSMDFILVSGTEGNITIEGEENLLEYIVTEVKDNVLKVRVKKGKNLKFSKNKTIKITIPFEDINKVSLSGSGDLWNKDVINATNLNVALAGSGDIVLNVKTSSIEGSVAGSGDFTLKGSTNNLEAKVAGSGDFHGFDLQANNTEVSIAGSGDAEVVSNQSIKARVAGSGGIVYKGNPEKNDTKVAGSGSITN
ncbi:head GIN domain-containing protein [Wocania ichthyoenteri]|uniref:head GIN domain-containing protein n=1 Tax=Wocania ichthyoenteri TaxID=1230531 RepID=UPI00068BFA8B|nr:head GIN domain-containing protein [Wocania ichthyoenteri]